MGRIEELPDEGDYMTMRIAGEPIVIAHGSEGEPDAELAGQHPDAHSGGGGDVAAVYRAAPIVIDAPAHTCA